MKGRDQAMITKSAGAPTADLLVCFPSRAHLTLRPKQICSPNPVRPFESNNRQYHHFKSGSSGGISVRRSHVWTKNNKQMGSEISEPTSPKVTCAGQIKVRHKTGQCKSWQSVIEQIERIHNKNEEKKKMVRSSWVESIGFKKEVVQFLTCLRNVRFDFQCFGSLPDQPDISSDDEDESFDEAPRAMFSKWFMVLQENNNNNNNNENNYKVEEAEKEEENGQHSIEETSIVPPPNALLLMRCRSAPTKSRFEEKEEEEEENDNDNANANANFEEEESKRKDMKKSKSLKFLMEEENKNNNIMEVMSTYDCDYYKISSDIAKETWVVGEIRDLLSRSKSSKR